MSTGYESGLGEKGQVNTESIGVLVLRGRWFNNEGPSDVSEKVGLGLEG